MAEGSRTIDPSGLALAALAFVLTRLFVGETLQEDPESILVAGVVPLVAGLALTTVGVALAVGAYERHYARTVWRWSAIGTGAMVLVLVTASFHSVVRGDGLEPVLESEVLVGNVLLGGAIGGALVGDRVATYASQREEISRFAERAILVNRRLRHEVLNAAAVIEGYASDLQEGDEEAVEAIRRSAERIEETVDEVGKFSAVDGEPAPVELGPVLDSLDVRFGDDVRIDRPDDQRGSVYVAADQRIELVFRELVENALEHAGPDPTVVVDVSVFPDAVEVAVSDDGPGLPAPAVEVVESRLLPQYDDPSYGYGLQKVALLVDHYGGELSTTEDDGTTVTVGFQRSVDDTSPPISLGVPRDDLYRVGAASVVAGVATGLFFLTAEDLVPVIGSLYGVESPVVGWIAHLFHSVVFGLVFAAACNTRWLREPSSSVVGSTSLGVAFGVVLWIVTAGVVMPIWLRPTGAELAIPNLTVVGLLSHVLWGAVVGGLYRVQLTDAGESP